jgi:hypothetical protein
MVQLQAVQSTAIIQPVDIVFDELGRAPDLDLSIPEPDEGLRPREFEFEAAGHSRMASQNSHSARSRRTAAYFEIVGLM